MSAADNNNHFRAFLTEALPQIASLLEHSATLHLALLGRDGAVHWTNGAMAKLLGCDAPLLVGRNIAEFLASTDIDLIAGPLAGAERLPQGGMLMNFLLKNNVPHTLQCSIVSFDSKIILLGEPMIESNRSLQDELLQLNSRLVVLSRENIRKGRDLERTVRSLSKEIEQRKKAESELLRYQDQIVEAMAQVGQSEAKFRAIFEQSPLGVALTDSLTGQLIEVNNQFAENAGRSREELTSIDWMSITHPDDRQAQQEQMDRLNAGEIDSFQIDKRYLRPSGSVVWVHLTVAPVMIGTEGRPCYLGMVEDITERKRYELEIEQARDAAAAANRALQVANAELYRLASTDPLTGVCNRRYFEQGLEVEMARAQRYGEPLALALLDIDHFKSINDSFGHHTGDEVLIEVTKRAQCNLRTSDLLARWGGEEFVVLLPHCNAANAMNLAEKLRVLIAEHPFPVVGPVTASFGVAEYWPPETLDSWVMRVDAALYEAKSAGRNTVRLGL